MNLQSTNLSQTRGASREALSALVDDECSHDELDAVLQAFADDEALRADWVGFHCIGDVLRGQGDASMAQPGFVAAVMAGIAAEQAQTAPSPLAAVHPVELRVSTPANDAVFRWRLVAGLAAVAALASVAWQVAVPSVSAPQLAQAKPAWGAPAVELAQARTEAVQTDRGVVLRDPQLEALIATHRQWGGMSALEIPSGVNTASFEVPQR